jgi:N-acyl homoserine lactone hydrolase
MKLKTITSMMLTLLLMSCAQVSETKNTVKLYVFDCGTIEVSDISVFSPGHDKGVAKTLKNTCYLIDHPMGKLIWDTGLADALINKKDGMTNGVFHLSVQKTLASQLKAINIDPKSIDYMALSHFHFDHSGNANLFENAKLLIQKEEFAAIYSKDPTKYHFDPKSYSKIKKDRAVILNGNYNVFGDDSVMILKTIGHTPGHQSLKLKLKTLGTIVLSGDLYHFEKNRKFRRVPSFNYNAKSSKESMQEIEYLLIKENATLWIQHDPKQFAKFKFSPSFYR